MDRVIRRTSVAVDELLDKWLTEMLEMYKDIPSGHEMYAYDLKISVLKELKLIDEDECNKIQIYFAEKLDEAERRRGS